MLDKDSAEHLAEMLKSLPKDTRAIVTAHLTGIVQGVTMALDKKSAQGGITHARTSLPAPAARTGGGAKTPAPAARQ